MITGPVIGRTVILPDEKATEQLAEKISREIRTSDVLALYGELGVGKTSFTQYLCKALGVHEYVSSPSYVLINEYKGRLEIAHVDLYRLNNPEEVWELGLEEFFEQKLTIIEWPEIAKDILPARTIHFYFSFLNKARKVKIMKGHV